jgi:hypothetical protein
LQILNAGVIEQRRSRLGIFIKPLPQAGRGRRLRDAKGGFEKRIRSWM